nr:MAG TPA: hypothetical protein [Caudoviricetes sp.]
MASSLRNTISCLKVLVYFAFLSSPQKIKVKSLIIAPRRLRQDARGVAFYDSLVSDINVGTKRNLLDKNSQVVLVTTSVSLPLRIY